MSLDAELGSQPGLPGKVLGLVAGAYAGLSSVFHVITDLIDFQLADGHFQFFDIDHGTCKYIFPQQVRRGLGLAMHRGWAQLMPDRCRDLVQHTNQPRPCAAETTDKDNEEVHAAFGDKFGGYLDSALFRVGLGLVVFSKL